MERQKPSTTIHNNDDYSKALIESTISYFNNKKIISEEGIPSLQKKGGEDDFSRKDPKANAAVADPSVDLRTGAGVKQSHGAKIKYTNVVAKEGYEEKEKKSGKECKPCEDKKEKVKETFNIHVEGVHYVFEKMDGVDDNGSKTCWKGYRKAGTKMKGGKEVNNCVKAGYEPFGELILDEKTSPSATYGHMVNYIEEKNGLYANIHAKRKRGEAPAKPGHEDYPAKDAFKKAAKTAKKEEYDVDTANQLWSEVAEKLEQLGEMDGSKFKVIGEKKDLPGNQEKIDANKNGKVDAHDFMLLRRKKVGQVMKAKKKVEETLQLEQEIEEEKKQ